MHGSIDQFLLGMAQPEDDIVPTADAELDLVGARLGRLGIDLPLKDRDRAVIGRVRVTLGPSMSGGSKSAGGSVGSPFDFGGLPAVSSPAASRSFRCGAPP